VISALAGKGDLILADKLSHACMLDGAWLSSAEVKRFAHNDMAHLERLLQAHRGEYTQCLILTETIFSMDGDAAPLDALYALAQRFDAWMMTDDAHGMGFKPPYHADIQMGTLSKAVGGYGGYVCGSRVLIDYLVNAARSLIFSTGLPPAVIAGNLAALQILRQEPERAEKALANARLFAERLGLARPDGPIVPLIIGEPEEALEAAEFIRKQGFYVSAIRPPTVPPHTARLRFAFSALHEEYDIERLTKAIIAYGTLPHSHD